MLGPEFDPSTAKEKRKAEKGRETVCVVWELPTLGMYLEELKAGSGKMLDTHIYSRITQIPKR